MPLIDFKQVLIQARKEAFGVGAFNPVDYASTRVIIETAESLDAPVILQTSAKTVSFYGHKAIADWVRHLAEDTTVPVSLHLDHGKDLDMIRACLDHGWTNVMIDASDLPFEQNLERSRTVYELAQPYGVSIEAEIGEIHGVEEDIVVEEGHGSVVDPEKAVLFCEAMDLGVFAPAIGTAHGIYKGEPKIEWDTLETLYGRIPGPFALHGGTGLEDNIIQRCIGLGCAKVNISTQLKIAFVDGFCDYHRDHPQDYEPLRVIGGQMKSMSEVVRDKITQFGGAGKGAALLTSIGETISN